MRLTPITHGGNRRLFASPKEGIRLSKPVYLTVRALVALVGFAAFFWLFLTPFSIEPRTTCTLAATLSVGTSMAIRVRGTTILISRVRLQFESTLIRLLAIDRKSSQPTTSLDSSCPATSRSFELWEAELEIESERGEGRRRSGGMRCLACSKAETRRVE